MANITGSGRDDTLTGSPGRDTIRGRGGNDLISGDLGNDTIRGADGADRLFGEAGNDRIFGGQGNDMLYGGIGNDRIVGGGDDDVIFADQGNDQLLGGRGNDLYIFSGSFGRDFITDGAGRNTLDLSELNGDLTVNLVRSGLKIRLGDNSVNWSNNTRIFEVETGNGDDFFLGFARRAERFDGGLGEDTLSYRNIQDTRFGLLIDGNFADGSDGLAGRINFRGRADEIMNIDQVFGTNARDTISLESSPNGVYADLKAGLAEDLVTARQFQFTSFEILVGSTQSDQLIGNDLANTIDGRAGDDLLDGGLGRDILIGGTGDDFFVVDNSGDLVSEEFGEGHDTIRSSVSFTLQENIEDLELIGSANLRATGNRADNLIIGNQGSNDLGGLTGSDQLQGGLGNDQYLYDYFLSGNESDQILDTAGNDTLNLSGLNGGVTIVEAQGWIWHAVDSAFDSGSNIDQLQIITNEGLTITIDNFFNDQSSSVDLLSFSSSGTGVLENIQLSDGTLRIEDILNLLS